MARSIAETFELLRAKHEIALMPFLPAGYPDLQTTTNCILALQDAGANLIEIGFPFSDPVADGPAIQEAFTHALDAGIRVSQIIKAVAAIKHQLKIPLVAMLSFSIVYRIGVEKFARELREAGFAGMILPDLPPPEAKNVCEMIRNAGLDTILLIAPTTSPARRIEIAQLCSGFVYYLSLSGITGERDELPADVIANVREIKSHNTVPVCVGFGIHRAPQVQALKTVADGAIVGTAFVRRIQQHLHDGPDAIARSLVEYSRELREAGSLK